jgi:hypothetical protein
MFDKNPLGLGLAYGLSFTLVKSWDEDGKI